MKTAVAIVVLVLSIAALILWVIVIFRGKKGDNHEN